MLSSVNANHARPAFVVTVNLLLLCLLALSLARVTWRMLAGGGSPEISVSAPSGGLAAAGDESPLDVSRIVAAHLFGTIAAGASEPIPTVAAPPTTLDLVLKGIMFAEHEKNSRAIIATSNGPQIAYAVGATVPGGAALEAMYADRVILLRNGHYETLYLSEKKKRGVRAAASTVSSGPPKYTVDKSNNLRIARLLGDYRARVLKHPEMLGNLVRVQPVERGGRFIGFRLQVGDDPRLLSRIGLQAGDVVTSVNGTAIDSPLKGLEIMRELADARRVRLNVIRNGELIALDYRIAQQ